MSLRLLAPLLVATFAVAASCDRVEPPSQREVGTVAVQKAPNTRDPYASQIYMCPMDRDIRSYEPGTCPRCRMNLVASIPEPAEYHLDLTVTPSPRPNQSVHVKFSVFDPWKGNLVTKFGVVHEKLFHAFIVSRDLEFFVHDHPEWTGSSFDYDIAFPKPGMYRILGDFYPEAATPQLLAQTLFVAGSEAPAHRLVPDYSPKQAENLRVELSTNPPSPLAGAPTQLRFTLSPGTGIERLLGAWGHLLAASDDLIDMMHEHPSLADGGPEMQFSLVFPRPRTYRVWVQFQRNGVLNTAHFDVRVGSPAP